MEEKRKRANDVVDINAEILKDAIEKSTFSREELSAIFGRTRAYIDSCIKNKRMSKSHIDMLSMILKQDLTNAIIKPETKETTDGAKPQERDKSLQEINDAMTSICLMVEDMRKNIKKMSDEISTMKDITFTQQQEAKRFFTDANTFFKNFNNIMKFGK